MTPKEVYPIVLTFLVVSLVLGVGIIVLEKFANSPQWEGILCCDGQPCSDTYYDRELNKCVLTTCAHMPFGNKSQCYYEPKNITALAQILSKM